MILILDNYDSFTYNLVSYFREMGEEVVVVKNDSITARGMLKIQPNLICLSPGPGCPKDIVAVRKMLDALHFGVPVLGICLGHQIIGELFGAKTIRAPKVMHGKLCKVWHNGAGLFQNIPQSTLVTRYHSLLLDTSSVSKHIDVTAWTDKNEVMGIKHKELPLEGIQFHPESLFTEYGKPILRNFILQYGPRSLGR